MTIKEDMTILGLGLLSAFKDKTDFTSDEIKEVSSLLKEMVDEKSTADEIVKFVLELVTESNNSTERKNKREINAMKERQLSRSSSLLNGLSNLGQLDEKTMSLIATGLNFEHQPDRQVGNQYVHSL